MIENNIYDINFNLYLNNEIFDNLIQKEEFLYV